MKLAYSRRFLIVCLTVHSLLNLTTSVWAWPGKPAVNSAKVEEEASVGHASKASDHGIKASDHIVKGNAYLIDSRKHYKNAGKQSDIYEDSIKKRKYLEAFESRNKSKTHLEQNEIAENKAILEYTAVEAHKEAERLHRIASEKNKVFEKASILSSKRKERKKEADDASGEAMRASKKAEKASRATWPTEF